MGLFGKLFGLDNENSYPNWLEKYVVYPNQISYEPIEELAKKGKANKDEQALLKSYKNGSHNDYFGARYRVRMPCPSCHGTSVTTSSREELPPGSVHHCSSCHSAIVIYDPKGNYRLFPESLGSS